MFQDEVDRLAGPERGLLGRGQGMSRLSLGRRLSNRDESTPGDRLVQVYFRHQHCQTVGHFVVTQVQIDPTLRGDKHKFTCNRQVANGNW